MHSHMSGYYYEYIDIQTIIWGIQGLTKVLCSLVSGLDTILVWWYLDRDLDILVCAANYDIWGAQVSSPSFSRRSWGVVPQQNQHLQRVEYILYSGFRVYAWLFCVCSSELWGPVFALIKPIWWRILRAHHLEKQSLHNIKSTIRHWGLVILTINSYS